MYSQRALQYSTVSFKHFRRAPKLKESSDIRLRYDGLKKERRKIEGKKKETKQENGGKTERKKEKDGLKRTKKTNELKRSYWLEGRSASTHYLISHRNFFALLLFCVGFSQIKQIHLNRMDCV